MELFVRANFLVYRPNNTMHKLSQKKTFISTRPTKSGNSLVTTLPVYLNNTTDVIRSFQADMCFDNSSRTNNMQLSVNQLHSETFEMKIGGVNKFVKFHLHFN